MSSRLTLAEVRSQLYTFVNPTDADDPEFLLRLNRVCERFINSGKWAGTKGVVDFANTEDGFITLPRRYVSVLGVDINKVPRPTYGAFHEYLEGGPGQLDEATMPASRLVDMGEFPTMSAMTEDGTLRLVRGSASDNEKTVRLYGKDENGDVIYDTDGQEGISVTLSASSQDTTQVFSEITAVQKEVTTGTVTLSAVVDAVATELSVYEPTETVPLYRRYKVGITADPIRCWCKRRFVLLVKETDIVLPGNLRALKLGLQAERFEFENDTERANTNWGMAFQALNEELREQRGGINLRLKIEPGPKVAWRW